MNFNDLTVKITSNENYQSLQPNKQEQIKALIKGYESYAQNITQSFYDNIAKMQKETQDKIKNAKTWGTILNFASLGTYPTVKGLVNGLTDLATGVINIRTQLVNNIGQIYAQDGRFGGGIDGFFKELGSDWLYTVADPIISVAEGLIKGGGSVANIFGWDDKEFNRFLDLTTNWSLYERDRILTLGEKEDDSFSRISWFLNDTSSPDKGKLIKEHTWDWARDFSIAVAQGGTWFKDNVSPVIGKMIIPLGIAIDDLGQNEAGEFFSGTMESVGRMIPAIVAAYFGDATALATAASQIYFFSSSFGNGFSEAIARGATLEEAYTYGYGTAAIETLTEQIGGVQIGKLLPGGVATKVATSKIGKVLQHPVMRVIKAGIDEGFEEVMSEAMSAGLESIISDDPVSNQDFMSRAMSAFLGGAISGGVFGSAGYYTHQKSTVGKVNSLNKEIKRIYEGQNKDYGKAQQVFNQKVDSLLNSYNRDSVVDNNLIEEGKRTPESRIQAKKDLLENSGFASILIEYNEQNQNFQLTKKGIEMTTDLEGYMGDSNKNAYSSTLYGLEDTLATKVTNQELNSEQQDVMKLSKKLGSDVVFYTDSDTSINGFFNDGIVYLNTESKKSYLTNFIHELTHSLEGTKQYDTLKNFLMEISETNEILKAKMEELGLTKESIVKDYWNQISNLNNIESKAYFMASEYVAFAMSEVILKDKASIESLTKNKTIGRKILNWIKEKIEDIKTPKTDIEKAFLKDLKHAKDLYEEALGVGYRKGFKIGEVDKRFSSDIRYSIKVGDKIFKIPKSITGFFNSNVEGNLEASIDEVHYIKANLEGDRKERKYSEKSKAELEKFFKLFDSFDNMGNNMDAIVDNLLLEYGNQIEYKEIIGTKYVYIWVLTSHNNEIRNLLIENVEARVNATLNEARKNKTITLDENVEGLYKVNDTSTFRKVFALNYIVADPKYAASVSLYDTRTYANEARDMFLFNDGFGGFIVSKDELLIDNSYKNENAEKYQYRTAFESSELSSVFNNGELKISKEMINYMTNGLGVKNIVATNTKLESIYKSWGFKETDIRYNYDNKIMSEWSNSYNNYLLFNSEQNNTSPIYSNLQMMKKAEEGRKTHIENMKDIRFSKTTDSEGRKLTVEQEKYFKDSKVVDEDGNLLVVYHGTTWDFNIFDKARTNVENDFGQGFYFTNIDYDAENNYSSEEGIDLSKKIERLAEQIESIDGVGEKVAFERARTILLGSENKILEVFLNITNPATNDTILIDRESFFENYNEEDFESYEEYEEQVESEFQDFLEETIYDIERILDFELDDYSIKNLKKLIYELSYENFSLYDVKEYINRNYEFDDGEGNLATNEIVRALVESLGYDGIIDDRVSMKFKGMGLGRDTVHYIVFNSNQIKNTDNLKPTNNPDIRYSINMKLVDDFRKEFDIKTLNNNEISEWKEKTIVNLDSKKYKKDYEFIPIDTLLGINEFDRLEMSKTYADKNEFDKYILALVDSFKELGLKEPLFLNYNKNNNFITLGEGNHRLLVATILGINEMPVVAIESPFLQKDTKGIRNGVFVKDMIDDIKKPSDILGKDLGIGNIDFLIQETIENDFNNNNEIDDLLLESITSTSNGDIRYSRNVENGIDNNKEMEILDNVIKDTYQNYNKKSYLDTITKRRQTVDEINLKEISKTTNGKKRVKIIETLMKDYERIIKKSYNRSELDNHIFNNVIQEIILELSNNFGDTTFANKARVVDSIESIVSQTMAYMDNTFNNNQYNLLDKENPNGYQYTKLINWGFRELLEASTPSERNAVLQSRKLSPLWDMIENIVKLDITNNQSILEFNAGIKNFLWKTTVEQRNVFGLDGDKSIHTIPYVLKQNDTHIENLTKLVGTMELQSKDGKKTTYKRTNGLLGDVRLFDKLSGTRLDMFAFGNIFGLFMEKSTGKVITERILEAQYQQLEVSNKFYEYFEKDGFLKKNRENIDLLEQEVSSLTNLLDGNGKPIIIPNSQVIYLRDVMLREIIRDRMIENGYRGGEQSNYFKDDGFVFINGNSNNRKTNEANRVQAKITNVLDLFNELDSIVKENKFMTEYNQKLLGFFELMYEFENTRNKDISGRELTNDKDTIAYLTEEQKAILTSGLNEVNIDSIYVPMRYVGSNKSSGAGAFDINNVIDLGIDDGMVMGITESNNPPLIDSINNIIPQYTRSVANFYGLFRVVNDLNILFNKEISLSDGSQITLADKVSKISPYIVPYYEKLLRDISGYGVNSDITSEGFNRFMGKIRRNFFKASLGLNAKVILTQFASMFTISTMYGDFKGTKKSLMLSTMKNIFAKGSKTKAKYLIENSEIYKDRARNSTYEISEATSNAFNKSKFNEVTEFLMKGITVTDNMINRAFFISLVEHGYTEAQALKMTEEAISRYQSSGLSINKNELLRTQNELVRVFTKFLGEPMKVVSNIEESIKHIQIINRLEKNQESINKSFDNDLQESQELVETLKQEKIAIEDLIDNEKEKAKKKALEKTLKDIDKNIHAQEENVLEQEKNNAQIKKQVQGVIDGKANARKELGKRVTAFMLSITWQTLLGVAFSALRTGGKDKDEDEEVWGYLGKKFGWQLATEAMGYLPFARDIYSLIVDKYDANVVSDFQAFNDLGRSISGILTDMTNGGDFNYGKHIRKVSIHLGQILGIPTRQIERLFTTPTSYFMKGTNYAYRDMTGQYTTNKELTDAIKNGDDKLIETILNRRLNSKGVSLTDSVSKEINRLAKNGVVVNPSGIPNSFSIDGVEYKNDKDKFAKTYNNATFVIEKIITLNGYKRLSDEYKAKLVKAIFTYYHSLAKQNVSGVQIFTKERTYNLNQAYGYFRDRISYYMNQQQKEKKKREPN